VESLSDRSRRRVARGPRSPMRGPNVAQRGSMRTNNLSKAPLKALCLGRSAVRSVSILISLFGAAACSSSGPSTPVDGSHDTGAEHDATTDAPPTEVGLDVGPDIAPDIAHDVAHDVAPDATHLDAGLDAEVGQGDGGADAACSGTAPLCFGGNITFCCGNDPAGAAVCSGGAWMCGSAPAPGCNGISCLLPPDAGDAGSDAGPHDTGPG
jgi:hypothetical protein